MLQDIWYALADFFERLLPPFARSRPPVEPEEVVTAPSRETVTRERRRQAKGIRACEIEFGDSAVNGMVLKVSQVGADIRLPLHMKDLPDFFTLKLAPSEKHDCRVLWREGNKVKVSFI